MKMSKMQKYSYYFGAVNKKMRIQEIIHLLSKNMLENIIDPKLFVLFYSNTVFQDSNLVSFGFALIAS